MDNRKRLREEQPCEESLKTPEKRIVTGQQRIGDGNFKNWGIGETCSYLRLHGLGEWEQKFRGKLCSLIFPEKLAVKFFLI